MKGGLTGQPRNSGKIIEASSSSRGIESVVREFFRREFNESARLVKSERIGNTLHVTGFRPLAPAERHAAGSPEHLPRLRQYHEELFKRTRHELQAKLAGIVHAPISSMECLFDPADHRFEIVIVLNEEPTYSHEREIS